MKWCIGDCRHDRECTHLVVLCGLASSWHWMLYKSPPVWTGHNTECDWVGNAIFLLITTTRKKEERHRRRRNEWLGSVSRSAGWVLAGRVCGSWAWSLNIKLYRFIISIICQSWDYGFSFADIVAVDLLGWVVVTGTEEDEDAIKEAAAASTHAERDGGVGGRLLTRIEYIPIFNIKEPLAIIGNWITKGL